MTEQAEAKPQIFVSYSRSEMYYAEAVTNLLQESGLNIWFDLQQLEPGCNWKEDIGRGLASSTEMILIASHAALSSPYVAMEWQHAIKNGHAIHILVFEELVFGNYSYTDSEGKIQTIDTSPLLEHAKTIMDGRGNFKKVVKVFLAQLLKTDEKLIQKIPPPNRLRIPMKLPLGAEIVVLGILFLQFILVRVIMAAFETSAYAVALGFGFLLILTGRELWNFIRRKSFGGTRNTLFLATLISIIFAILSAQFFRGNDAKVFSAANPLAFIFFFAWWQSVFSLSLNRWAPRGEGIRRDVTGNRSFLRANVFAEAFRIYANLKWLYRIYALFLIYSASFIMVIVLQSACLMGMDLCSDGEVVTPSVFLLALIPVGLLIPLDLFYHYRSRKLIKNSELASRSFRVIYNAADQKIALQVDRIMRESGHRSQTILKETSPSSEELDFYILIVSNYLQLSDFESFQEKSGRWIVLVASSLENRDWHQRLQNFQWVDYRSHSYIQFKLIADELQETRYDVVSTSLSSRTSPQSFSQNILPMYVQAFVFIILVLVNAFVALFATSAWSALTVAPSSDEELVRNIVLILIIVVYLPIIIYTIRSVVDISLREVSQTRVNNLAFVIFSIPILSRAGSGDIHYLWAIVLFIILNRVSYLWMQHWIPEKPKSKAEAETTRVSGMTRRKLYQNVLFVMFTLIMLSISLGASRSNYTEILGRAFFIF